MSRNMKSRVLAGVLVAGLVVTGCGESEKDEASSSAKSGSCAVADLDLVKAGTLTIGTDSPAYPPWFEDDDPSNGKGFEGEVAYAVAEQLGFDAKDVTWATVAFDSAIKPGAKDFDFDINQFSISDERAEVVDFSDGYYEVNQAIAGYEDSAASSATTLSDLKGLKLGAQVGTTSLDYINDVIKPDAEPLVYNDNNAAKAALAAKQIDAIVLDLPTALYVTAAEIENTVVIGQLPTAGTTPEEFGLVFEKGSSLTSCVNDALAALKSDGKLDAIREKYLASAVAPEIAEG